MLEANKLNIDEKELKKMWHSVQSKTVREIIKRMGRKRAFTFSEIGTIVNEIRVSPKNITAYYIKKMVDSRFIKKEDKRYFLTRHGLEMLKVINTFDNKCMKYDISDCNSDGRIEVVIRR